MNTLKIIFCGYSLLFSLALSAQKKPSSGNIPYHTKIEISSKAIENLFHINGSFSTQLSPDFTLSGSIQSRTENENASVISLLIKTENLQGATLSLSRSLRPDGSIQYTGHLLKLHDADGMLLFEKDGQYYFIRTEQRFLVSE